MYIKLHNHKHLNKMKKILFLFLCSTFLISCGADQATVDKITLEMCQALDGVDTTSIYSLMDAATAMEDISSNDSYGDVTQAQLESAMKDKCPASWKVLEEIMALGGE